MKVYTKTGDEGTTWMRGGRASKDDPLVDAVGYLDELNSTIGWLIVTGLVPEIEARLAAVQSDLFSLGAHVADPGRHTFDDSKILADLEHEIDCFTERLPELKAFILPGGSEAAARLHLARAVCRRCERAVVKSGCVGSPTRYLNRLSDWLFTAARLQNYAAGIADPTWKKPC